MGCESSSAQQCSDVCVQPVAGDIAVAPGVSPGSPGDNFYFDPPDETALVDPIESGDDGGCFESRWQIAIEKVRDTSHFAVETCWIGAGGGNENSSHCFHPSNMQLAISGLHGTTVTLKLVQQQPWRDRASAGFLIYSIDDVSQLPLRDPRALKFLKRGGFSQNPVEVVVPIPSDGSLFVLCSRVEQKSADFTVEVSSDAPVNICYSEPLPRLSDTDFCESLELNGHWEGTSAGGLLGDATFCCNPSFELIVTGARQPCIFAGELLDSMMTVYNVYVLDCEPEVATVDNVVWALRSETTQRTWAERVLLPDTDLWLIMAVRDKDRVNSLKLTISTLTEGTVRVREVAQVEAGLVYELPFGDGELRSGPLRSPQWPISITDNGVFSATLLLPPIPRTVEAIEDRLQRIGPPIVARLVLYQNDVIVDSCKFSSYERVTLNTVLHPGDFVLVAEQRDRETMSGLIGLQIHCSGIVYPPQFLFAPLTIDCDQSSGSFDRVFFSGQWKEGFNGGPPTLPDGSFNERHIQNPYLLMRIPLTVGSGVNVRITVQRGEPFNIVSWSLYDNFHKTYVFHGPRNGFPGTSSRDIMLPAGEFRLIPHTTHIGRDGEFRVAVYFPSSSNLSFVPNELLVADSLEEPQTPTEFQPIPQLSYLLSGVDLVLYPAGAAGPLCVFGEDSFAILTGRPAQFKPDPAEVRVLWCQRYEGQARTEREPCELFVPAVAMFQKNSQSIVVFNGLRWFGMQPVSGDDMPTFYDNLCTELGGIDVVCASGTQFLFKGMRPSCALSDLHDQSGAAMIVLTPDDVQRDLTPLETFLSRGNSAIIVASYSSWHRSEARLSVVDPAQFPLNRLLLPYGIAFLPGSISCTLGPTTEMLAASPDADYDLIDGWWQDFDGIPSEVEGIGVKYSFPTQAHSLRVAKELLRFVQNGDLPTPFMLRPLVTVLYDAPSVLPVDHGIMSILDQICPSTVDITTEAPCAVEHLFRRLRIVIDRALMIRTSIAKHSAYHGHVLFPGVVAGSDRLSSVSLSLPLPIYHPVDNASYREPCQTWLSTSLYVPAGEPVVITLPEVCVRTCCRIQIGCHTDDLYHTLSKEWKRFPSVTCSYIVTSTTMTISTPFGGLLFVSLPQDVVSAQELSNATSSLEVVVQGAVSAPMFELGQTSLSDWASQISSTLSPWGEITGQRCSLFLPTRLLQALDNPQPIIEDYDRVTSLILDVLGDSSRLGHWERPERICPDVTISCGSAHSGYPMMYLSDLLATRLIDTGSFFSSGTGVLAVHGHELGHNLMGLLPGNPFNFEGSVEAIAQTVSQIIRRHVTGRGIYEDPVIYNQGVKAVLHMKDTEKSVELKFRSLIADAYNLMSHYLYFLEDSFPGCVTQVLTVYSHRIREDGSPLPLAGRRDFIFTQLSIAVSKDLSEYFFKFGIPISASAVQEVRALAFPTWLPELYFSIQ